MATTRKTGVKKGSALLAACALLATVMVATPVQVSAGDVGVPKWSKTFEPNTIGPGSVSTLRFVITNGDPTTGAADVAFSDTLPAGVTIATPANTSNSCDGTLTAPDGGSTISLSDGQVGTASSCTMTVDVTSSTVATHTNLTGDLTSSLGNSGTVTDDLTVDTDLPGFSKYFAPDPIDKGERSTLTFLIDNTASPSNLTYASFDDTLPAGLVIADPANASTDCGGMEPPTLTAAPGTDVITFDAVGFDFAGFEVLLAGATCSVVVDVVAVGAGTLINSTEDLYVFSSAADDSAGKATASIVVTVFGLHLTKNFTDDPIPPGGIATLEFTIENFDRNFPATGVAFSDTLPVGVLVAAPSNAVNGCGGTLTAAGTTISLSGGTVPADDLGTAPFDGFCTITVEVTASASGEYDNTTGTVSGTVDGSPITGNAASETLFVVAAPKLTKEFTDDPVGPGDVATIHFEIEDTTTAFGSTDIAFTDNLAAVLSGLSTPASTITVDGTDFSAFFQRWSTLAPAGLTGAVQYGDGVGGNLDGCLPFGAATLTGLVVLVDDGGGCTTTDRIQNIDAGGAVAGIVGVTFPPAFPSHTAFGGGPRPTIPGYEIMSTQAATIKGMIGGPGIATIDTLDVALPLPDFCGAGAVMNYVDLGFSEYGLSMTDGSLLTGTTCTFDVSIPIPPGTGSGTYPNTTSAPTATVSEMTVTGKQASDDLVVIAGPTLTKEFTDDPIKPGDTVTLEFTLTNDNPPMPPATTDFTATGIGFTDDLAATVAGLTATALPLTAACDPDGAGGAPGTGTLSSSAGDTLLTFAGGTLAPGESCTFTVTLATATSTPQGVHTNTTSPVTSTVAGVTTTELPGRDDLTVADLDFTKSFTNDPVFPGGTVTLEFTIDNTSPTDDATSISFSDDFEDTLDTTPSAAGGSLALTAAEAATLPRPECGGTLFDGGGTTVTLIGGSLTAGSPPCTITLELDVPAAADAGVYPNTTTGFGADFGSGFVPLPNAVDDLVVDEAALGITKSFTDDPVEPGDTVNLKFTLSNPTVSAPGTDLAFTDDLEATLTGLLATGVFPVTDACVPAGGGAGTGTLDITGTQTLDYSGGTLAAGAACEIEVTLTVPAGASAANYPNTTSTLTGTVGGSPVTGDPATDTLRVFEPATSSADLSVSKTASPDPVTAGETLTYTITVDNAGPADAANVVVTDVLPAGVTYVSDTGGCTEAPVGTLTCSFGIVPIVPGTISFDVTVTVDADTPAGTITNDVSVTSNTSDPDSTNNTASIDTTVEVEADLAISVTDAPDPVLAGESLVYTITVNNLGPSDATSVTVTDTLSADATYVSDTDSCVHAPVGTLTCSLGTIAAMGSASFDITVDVDASTTVPAIANIASVSSSVPDPAVTNNTAFALTDVETEADLAITKTDSPDPVKAGETLTYTITIDNAGPSDALDVVVTDTLPAGVTFDRTSMYGLDRSGTFFAVDVSTGVGTPLGTLLPGTEIECDPAGAPTDCYLQEPNGNFTISPFDRKSVTLTGPPVLDGASFTGLEYVATTLYGSSIDFGGGPSTFSTLDPVTGASTPIGPTGVGPISGLAYDTTSSVMYGIAGGPGPADLYTIDVTTGVATPLGNTGMQAGSLQFDIDGLLYAGGTGANAGEIWLIDPVTGAGTFVGATGLTSITGLTAVPQPCEAGPPGTVTCTLGSIAAGSSTSFDIVVTVESDTPAGVITNSASVDATTTDPNPGDNSTTEDTTVETEADLEIAKVGDATVIAGTSTTYTMEVINLGPSDATGVLVTDDVPAGLMYDTSTVPCAPSAAPGVLECDLGTIAAGGTSGPFDVTFTIDSDTPAGTITNSATVSSDIFDPDTSDNTATFDSDVETEADLAITKTDTTDPVLAGESVTYEFRVDNFGPSDASNVIVVDDVPAGLMYDSSGVTCTPGAPAAGQLTCDIGDLPDGSAITFPVTFTINSATPAGIITNEATVSSDITDPDTSNNTATEDTTIETEADLSITKTDITDPVLAGTSVTYEIRVENFGPSDATNVIVVDDVPADLMYDSSGVTCTPGAPAAGQLTCDIGDLPDGSAITFPVTFTINSATPAGIITNEATVSSDITDPDTSNNTATEDTTIETEADLSITKTDTTDPVLAGTSVIYTLEVYNAGPSDATGVTVVDDVPAGLMYDFSGVTCFPGVPGPGQLTCDLGDLPTGGAIFFDIGFTIDSDAPAGLITNEATVSSDIFDPDTTDNTATEDTTIETEADLAITKTDTTDPVLAGTSVTYTLEVYNAGPSDATNVIVTDDVPAGLMYDTSTVPCAPSAAPGVLECDLGTIAAGGTSGPFDVTFTIDSDTPAGTITNTATVSSDIFDPDTTDNTATEDTDIETEADLAIAKVGDATAVAGTSTTYTMEVINLGPSDATGVTVVDDVPTGLMFDSADVTCTPGVPAAGLLTCDLGTIAAGGTSGPFDVTFSVDATVPAGTITNTATVESDIDDPDTADNTATADTTIEIENDLFLTKTDTADPVIAGTTVTYLFDVGNHGPSDATGVLVTDDVPAGLMYDTSTVPCAPVAPGVLECEIIDIPAGFGGSFEITFTIDPAAPAGTITNTATVASDGTETDSADNTATEDTTIETEADLAVTKTDEADPVLAGTAVSYTITVDNIGPSDATDVTVVDTLPAGTTYVSDTGGCVEAPVGTLTCDLGTILASDAATFSIAVAVASDTTGTITNTATVSSATPDPDTSDNTVTEDTTIGVEADISITKTADVTSAVPGEDDITYTIVVLNAGPASDPAVAVADTFPAALACTYTSTVAGGATGNTASGSGNLADTLSMPPDSSATYVATCTIDPAATGTVTNTATADGSAVDLVTTNDSASVDVELTPEVDIAVSIETAAALVAQQSIVAEALGAATLSAAGAATGGATPGSTVTYTIVVSNLGPSADPAVKLTDSFPAALSCSWTSTATGGASGNTATGSGNIDETLSMPPGSSVTYSVNCTIDPAATGTLSNSVTATASVTDRSAPNNTAASSLKLTPSADISVTKDNGVTTLLPGFERSTYRITVRNAGPSADPKVALIDNFPTVLTCTWTSQAFGGASGNTASGSSSIGDQLSMPDGSSVNYIVSCSIDRNARGTVSNTATATASVNDPNAANNSATDTDELKVPTGNLPGTGSSGISATAAFALAAMFAGLLLVGLTRRSRRRKLTRSHA